MLKKVTGLFVLLVLGLLVSCVAKAQEASAEMLNNINGAWRMDIDAWVKVEPLAAKELASLGREEFAARYGQVGFDIDAVKHLIRFYDPLVTRNEPKDFIVPPGQDDASDLRLKLKENGEEITLRYGETQEQLCLVVDGVLAGVYARQK